MKENLYRVCMISISVLLIMVCYTYPAVSKEYHYNQQKSFDSARHKPDFPKYLVMIDGEHSQGNIQVAGPNKSFLKNTRMSFPRFPVAIFYGYIDEIDVKQVTLGGDTYLGISARAYLNEIIGLEFIARTARNFEIDKVHSQYEAVFTTWEGKLLLGKWLMNDRVYSYATIGYGRWSLTGFKQNRGPLDPDWYVRGNGSMYSFGLGTQLKAFRWLSFIAEGEVANYDYGFGDGAHTLLQGGVALSF